MAVVLGMLHRPASTADFAAPSRYRSVGVVLGLTGVMLAIVGLIANIVAAGDVGDGLTTRETLAWSFGLSTTAFATIKIGIGAILMGITIRLWIQFEGMKAALPQLKPAVEGDAAPQYGDVRTPFGSATQTATTPPPMPIERMVPRLWAPDARAPRDRGRGRARALDRAVRHDEPGGLPVAERLGTGHAVPR